jgi:Predicted membrane protein
MVVWSLTLARLGALRHDRFGTFGFDLGIYDQATWLLSRARDPFITVRGLEAFGHHVNVILLVLAPFYRLGAGPHFLLIVQVAAQASGAAAVFLLARDRIGDRWLAVVLGAVYLLHPTSQWLVWEFFHPDAVAIGPLLFAYWAARERRWKWFACAALIAAMCKEDVALLLVVIGLLVAWRGERRIGFGVSVGSLAWYVVATRVIIPWQNGIGPFYDSFFGTLGTNPLQVAMNSVRHPGSTWALLRQRDRLEYLWRMLVPVAFVPVISPSSLAIAFPMLAVNLLSSFPYTRDPHFHYSALVLVGVMIATVEGVARLPSPQTRRVLVGVILATSVATTVAWGPSPVGAEYRKGSWPLQADARQAVNEAAIREVPANAAVSASYSFVPHLTHRVRVYEFPVPWRDVNWGVRGEHLDDPGEVQWIVVDRRVLDSDGETLLKDLLHYEFRVRSDRDDVLVAQRVHSPRQ